MRHEESRLSHRQENCTGNWWFEEDHVFCMDCRARHRCDSDLKYEAIMSNYTGLIGTILANEGVDKLP